MKSKLLLLTLVVTVFCGVQAAKAQGNGYYKHREKEYKHRDAYERDGYRYRRNRDDDDDQGEHHRYYSSNHDGYYRNLPPGQAKKVYGYQSAKYFAPGQQKKRYRNDDNRYYNNRGYSQSNVLTTVIGSLLGY
ncbi:hypothetical protein [Niabella sp.]|uniref:hypothetical protein n=1 Tax=Niabella sp. TaxID=1962976 RepID=UPI00260E2738|nr:hypothetical protein [Niabella sp.]